MDLAHLPLTLNRHNSNNLHNLNSRNSLHNLSNLLNNLLESLTRILAVQNFLNGCAKISVHIEYKIKMLPSGGIFLQKKETVAPSYNDPFLCHIFYFSYYLAIIQPLENFHFTK